MVSGYVNGNSADGVVVMEFLNAGEVNLIGCHTENNKGSFNMKFDSPAGRHFNVIGGKHIPGEDIGSNIDIDHGELFISGSHVQKNGTNVHLSLNTASATIIGDIGGGVSGVLTNLVRIRHGQVVTGGKLDGGASAGLSGKGVNGVGVNCEGLLWFSSSTGSRLGYLSESGITRDADGVFTVATGNGSVYFMRTGPVVEPASPNQYYLGSGALPWAGGFTQTAFSITSDLRTKPIFSEIPDSWIDAWEDVSLCRYKVQDAIELKGLDNARWHVGTMAQWIQEAFVKRGLDPFQIGILCWDKWEDLWDEKPILGKDGQPEIDPVVKRHQKLTPWRHPELTP